MVKFVILKRIVKNKEVNIDHGQHQWDNLQMFCNHDGGEPTSLRMENKALNMDVRSESHQLVHRSY